MVMRASTAAHRSARWGTCLTAAGLVVLVVAALLYASGLSRAGAVWAGPVGLIAVVFGVATLRGHPVPRWASIALAAAVAVLLGLGLVTWIYETAHPPMST